MKLGLISDTLPVVDSPRPITGQTAIPDLLRTAPQVRPVLDRYGLHGCGGRLGPAETLEFFARAHDVPLGRLLDELRDHLRDPAPAEEPAAAPRPEDAIYRPFFRAGIAVALTLGAAWGAYLLVRIGLHSSFTAAGLHEVNAHGHAQIFGWVGLFVMGFAYQAFPRFKHTTLSHPRLARASLWLMVAGLAARCVLQPLAASYPELIAPAVAASALEVAAVGIFAWVVVATWRRSGKPLGVPDWYVLGALAWFVVQAVYESVYLAATLYASGPALVALVATWQPPLRDVQIHGFALLMILGVSQRLLHPIYGLPAPNLRRDVLPLLAINAAVLGEAVGLVLMRGHGHGWAALWYGSVLVLAVTVALLVAGWRVWATPADPEPSLKFVRAAYAWLFVSLGMLVLLPVYQYGLLPRLAAESDAARLGFSHAYYGAVRHAITVGFISLMIVGVAAKVVPTLNGVDARRGPRLWLPFVLLNAGCTLRVVGQVLTDFVPASFPVTAVSGLLELAGLAVWGVYLWRVMAGRGGDEAAAYEPLALGAPVTARSRVGEVLDRYPALLETFLAFGFRTLANPVARRTVARHVTLEAACGLMGVDVRELVAALEAARARLSRAKPASGDGACCSACAARAAAGVDR